MLHALNTTFLSIICKKDGANNFYQFQPISLCNVVYKIITKLLIERLKVCLDNLIFVEEGGFVAGKKIFDGIVAAIEVIHLMETSKEKAMFIKI